MKIAAKYCLLYLSLISSFCSLKADSLSILIETSKEYEILEQFFKTGILEEGYNYVLSGDKPISIRNYYSLDEFPIAKDLKYTENEFSNTLLIRETIPIWKKCCQAQRNFALKAVPLNALGSPELGWEVQFINIPKLQEIIEKNIDLFRYALGPTIDSKKLVNKIAYSNELLSDILRDDCVLTGIVLGFGSHNSIVGGRNETISASSFSRDIAPYTSKSLSMHKMKDYYGYCYLEFSGGEDFPIDRKKDYSNLKSSSGFLSIEEEIVALESLNDPLPICLKEKPAFIFGAYKGGPSNQPFFERLKKTQKQAQKLLKKPDFLEKVLEKIGGKKPRISYKKTSSSPLQLSSFKGSVEPEIWTHILDKTLHRFEDKKKQLAFIKSLSNSSSSFKEPPMVGVSESTLKGLKNALTNLSEANEHFEMLSKDHSLETLVPKQLYFKTLKTSSKKQLKNFDRIRIGYVITDLKENILFANYDTWLSLSDTIPGFAHGVQGMYVGEKRELFIHPSLAYGALTTLPPCTELIAKVELFDFDEKSSTPLPSLEPLDLSWIQNPKLQNAIEESIETLPYFIGSFYRKLLDQIEPFNTGTIIENLDKLIAENQ